MLRKIEGKQITGDLHIVIDGHDALLGRQWIRGLRIELHRIYKKTASNPTCSYSTHEIHYIHDIFQKFPKVFEEKIGYVPDFQVHLQLRPNMKPVFTKELSIPYALQEKLDKEHYSLEAQGIITLVPTSD